MLFLSRLYEEYCFCHSFHKAQWNRRTDDNEYNSIFCQLIRGVVDKTDGKERQNLLRRLYLESPMITEDSITLLKQFVQVNLLSFSIRNLLKSFTKEELFLYLSKLISFLPIITSYFCCGLSFF
jgi:hypothetical protein